MPRYEPPPCVEAQRTLLVTSIGQATSGQHAATSQQITTKTMLGTQCMGCPTAVPGIPNDPPSCRPENPQSPRIPTPEMPQTVNGLRPLRLPPSTVADRAGVLKGDRGSARRAKPAADRRWTVGRHFPRRQSGVGADVVLGSRLAVAQPGDRSARAGAYSIPRTTAGGLAGGTSQAIDKHLRDPTAGAAVRSASRSSWTSPPGSSGRRMPVAHGLTPRSHYGRTGGDAPIGITGVSWVFGSLHTLASVVVSRLQPLAGCGRVRPERSAAHPTRRSRHFRFSELSVSRPRLRGVSVVCGPAHGRLV